MDEPTTVPLRSDNEPRSGVQPSVSDSIDFEDETMVETGIVGEPPPGAHPLGPEYPALDVYGKYEILGRLAVGGMAEVFLAREMASHGAARHVAVKRILPQIADDDTFVEMFLDEARLAMRLNHPNICHIYDLGELDDTYFIAMEWVNGVPYGKLISRGREKEGMPINIAVKVMAHVADALNYAHQARDGVGRPLNVVHRDVSPQNIMVRFDGVVKLLDFGIAKAATQTTQTEAGIVKGKFAYMSPEQCLGKPLDARSDIFAIGACLYEGLTGKPAFRRASDLDTMRAIVHEPVPSVRLVRADVPPRLDAILRKAFAKDPIQRFQTAGEMYVALERFLAEQGEFIHAMHIASAVEKLIPEAATRGPLEPISSPSQRALAVPASGSRRTGGGQTKSDKNPSLPSGDVDTFDTHLESDPSTDFEIDMSEPLDEEELPTEQWSGEDVPSIIKELQAAARSADDATTDVANLDEAGVPSIFTDETAAVAERESASPSRDPFGEQAELGLATHRGPSTFLRVAVVLLALCAAALVTVAVVWSTTSDDSTPDVPPENANANANANENENENESENTNENANESENASESESESESGSGSGSGNESESESGSGTAPGVAVVQATGSITIATEPPGATVRLGDREGTSPLTWDDVEPGTYTVTASLDGHEESEAQVDVAAGGTAQISLVLVAPAPAVGATPTMGMGMRRRPPPPMGTLVLDTQPRGTRVFFGRTALGRTPLRARLPVGTVRLRLVTPDGSSHVRSVRIRPRGQSRAFLPLSR